MSDDNPFQSPQSETEKPGARHRTAVSEKPLNPWLSVWFRPRATIRYVIDTEPKQPISVLVVLLGMVAGIQGAAASNPDKDMIVESLIGGCIGGTVAVAVSFWFISGLIHLTSGWLGGVSKPEQVKAAIAWGYVPAIAGAVVWIPLLAMYGPKVFTGQFWNRPSDPTHSLTLLAVAGLRFVLGIWQLVIACKMIGEVNEFSAWRGWGAGILAGLVVFGICIFLGLVAVAVLFAVR